MRFSSVITAALSASRPLAWNACAYGPVWISQTDAPMRCAASTWRSSASMNTETTMPAPASLATCSRRRASCETMSSPPSVVISWRPLRNQHRHLRAQALRDRDHLLGRRHLEVELDVRELAQPAHILVLDMAPVLAQVHGDAVRAAEMRFDGSPYRIRLVGAARLPHRGYVVYVDAQLDHRSCSSFSTVRVCSV
jgi:hypothetical protein